MSFKARIENMPLSYHEREGIERKDAISKEL
jgi:hypothetical protein